MNAENQLTNNDFIKSIINIPSIKDIKLSEGCSGGDNFSSKVYRILIKSSDGDHSLIAKCISYEGERAFLGTMDIHGKEIFFYKEVLPQMQVVLGDNLFLAPKYFYSKGEPEKIIIIEDLLVKGYQIADRVTGLNFDEAKIVLEKLAGFHAASAVAALKSPEIKEKYSSHMFHNLAKHPVVFKWIVFVILPLWVVKCGRW